MEADIFVRVVSVSFDKAVVSFSLPEMSIVRAECIEPAEYTIAKTIEENNIGRVCLEGLKADTKYKVKVHWRNGERELMFDTLPEPVGQCVCKFAAISDPHISEKSENRKGRLFVESSMILSDIVEQINTQQMDFVLIAGDVTNASTGREYSEAKKILSKLSCPFYLVPGDHDVMNDGRKLWEATFGRSQWVEDYNNIRLIGIDTSSRKLGQEGLIWLGDNLADNKYNVVLSHFQLIPDDYISGPNRKIIEDYERCRDAIENLCEFNVIIYVGHQNIPSTKQMRNTMQINLPQPVQFPCGYMSVCQYENGFYHTFTAITSEVLNDYSRRFSELASSHLKESHWRAEYRVGRSINESNFIIPSFAKPKV